MYEAASACKNWSQRKNTNANTNYFEKICLREYQTDIKHITYMHSVNPLLLSGVDIFEKSKRGGIKIFL